jgi:hypothetical protein
MDDSITVAKQLAGNGWLHFKDPEDDSFHRFSIKGEIMKKWIFSAVATACVLVSMIVVPAQAQMMPGTTMHVVVPFDFIVREKILPAGRYEIKRLNDSTELLVVRNINDRHDQVVIDTESVEPRAIPNNSEVVFHRYGDSYFLSEVLTAGEQTGEELAPSRAERHLRREMASNNIASNNTAEPETISLAVY